jgi:argininosuccinate lyase
MTGMPRVPDDSGRDTASGQVLEIGARLRAGPSQRLVQAAFRKELEAQLDLFEAMSQADLAHTLMLMESGLIPPAPGRELLAALLDLHRRPADFLPAPELGDLYTNREAWLARRTPSAGWLGAGRARREATTTAFLMHLRALLLDLSVALVEAGSALVERARHFQGTPMADYTYWQSAQPTSFGHYLLGFVYPLLRDLDRLRALYGRVNLSPAGCGSSNGSRLFQDRQQLADWLGFEGLVAHARDAMWEADLPIESLSMAATAMVNLDRLAEDLQVFATSEFALVELDDSHARASKIMPQKKNPFALTHVRGVANGLIGELATAVAAGRTASGQPDSRLMLYGAVPKALSDAADAAALMSEMLQRLAFREEHAARGLEQGFALATDLADVLVRECGLDFREAHRLVGSLVREHQAVGSFAELTPRRISDMAEELLQRRIELSESCLRDALSVRQALEARCQPGGAAAGPMAAMLADCVQRLNEAAVWQGACRQQLEGAGARLLERARAFAADGVEP